MDKQMKFITADEACAVYKEAQEREIENLVRVINDGIYEACEDGETSFIFKTKKWTSEIVNSLKLAGYLVDVDPTDSDFIIISWNHLLKKGE